jgi:RNA polymerase sigma-70 factor (ECF subfamily)
VGDSRAPSVAHDDFETFFRTEYASVVRSVAPFVGTLAEDVTQEAFVAAYRQWERVRLLDAPRAWVCLVARRAAWRMRTRDRARSQREPAAFRSSDAAPGTEEQLDLSDAIRSLSSRQRAAIRLHYLADLPVQRVASMLGASETATKVSMHRARAQLAGALLAHEGTWRTLGRWSPADLERALDGLGTSVDREVLLEELPLGRGRWILELSNARYRIVTDTDERMDHGRFRTRRDGIELVPWNESGLVTLGLEVGADRARFTLHGDTTAPTRGIPDSVYLRLILGSRAFERRRTRA